MKRSSGLLTRETNTLWWFCALTLGTVLLVLATITSPMITKTAEEFGVSTREKPMTELYFSDHLNLPKSYEAGKELSFEVTLASRELGHEGFNFEIIENDDTGVHLEILESGSVNLAPGSKRILEISVMPRLTSPRSKISFRAMRISNPNSDSMIGFTDLQIHFWTERR
jgi:hypothetical protein